jgi:hybrid polyketide synthase / nonribosomal peptide synthetase ACE1
VEKMPLLQLGVDSLIAVELRAWFLKELLVDIPMLRLLGGSLVGDILSDAVARVPTSLVPNFISV